MTNNLTQTENNECTALPEPSAARYITLPERRLPAETRKKFEIIYDKDTNTTRRQWIVPTDDQRDTLEQLKLKLEQRLTPAPIGVAEDMLRKMVTLWPSNKGGGQEWFEVISQYAADLRFFSKSHLIETFNEIRQSCDFRPSSHHIYEIATKIRNDDLSRYESVLLSLNGNGKKTISTEPEKPKEFLSIFEILRKNGRIK